MPKEEYTISIIIPAHNEESCLDETIRHLVQIMMESEIPHEILVVNDNSMDKTEKILMRLSEEFESVRYINNTSPNGFGLAVCAGLNNFRGDAVAIVMADGSDSPHDLVKYYHKLQEGIDCVFGSRFMNGARVVDYPKGKLFMNRFANLFIRVVFRIRYNDITNAFKCYRRETIDGLRPFLSHHFNLTVELPLKCIVRGYSYDVIPTDWYNRTKGEAKMKIKEMGSRYMFIIFYCLLEKYLSRGDFQNKKMNPRNDH